VCKWRGGWKGGGWGEGGAKRGRKAVGEGLLQGTEVWERSGRGRTPGPNGPQRRRRARPTPPGALRGRATPARGAGPGGAAKALGIPGRRELAWVVVEKNFALAGRSGEPGDIEGCGAGEERGGGAAGRGGGVWRGGGGAWQGLARGPRRAAGARAFRRGSRRRTGATRRPPPPTVGGARLRSRRAGPPSRASPGPKTRSTLNRDKPRTVGSAGTTDRP
jgi:hypothetical protein